ncbi:MAG: toxin-antitoxin system, antitoxin component, Xre family protein [Proteobacteria bacterium]|nr:toxin-antitoxin system, antitoxin component, Xre family protein [Pseudomonadota bacterium]
MSPDKQSLIQKIESLPDEKVAEIEDFVDFIASRQRARSLVRAAMQASEASLARIWDNPEDDVYNVL